MKKINKILEVMLLVVVITALALHLVITHISVPYQFDNIDSKINLRIDSIKSIIDQQNNRLIDVEHKTDYLLINDSICGITDDGNAAISIF